MAKIKKKLRFGILHKVTATMLLVSMVPLLVVWYVNYQNSSDRIARHVDQYSVEVLGRLTSFVDRWVEMNVQMLRQNAMLPDTLSMEADRQNPVLELITQVYDWNYLAFTVDKKGKNIGRSDGKKSRYYGDRIYVRDVLSGKPLGKQVLIGKTSGKPALVLAVPIGEDSMEQSGVLAIAMTISDISEQIAGAKIGDTGFAFLVDEDGKVIAHPSHEIANSRQDLTTHPAVAAALKGTRSTLFTDSEGRQQISYIERTAEGWYMIVQQEYAEAFSELEQANKMAIALLLATLFIVAVVAAFFAKRLSDPIVHLTEISNALSHGNLDVTIEGENREDEIGELARSIGRLGESIRLAMARLIKQRKAQK